MKKLLLLLIIPFLSFGQIVTEDCNSIPDSGDCDAAFEIYYFNQNTGQCEESLWGGCNGLVPFWTLEDCQNSCENTEIQGCTDTAACNYNPLATEDDNSCSYSMIIHFKHFIDDLEISYSNDNIMYENIANNIYSVRRILYVLSDVTLYFVNSSPLILEDIIFVNSDNIETLTTAINNLPELCSGISFRLGLSSETNIDNYYIDAENQFHDYMIWPNSFGVNPAFQGGYHYMKLEGKYGDFLWDYYGSFYNTHSGPILGKDLSILYPTFNFNPTPSILINMNVNNWYNEPIYNMDVFGVGIMSNLDAQMNLSQNGLDVFSVESQEFYDCEECINDVDSDGICDELEIEGCMDPIACNYNTLATEDDESCDYYFQCIVSPCSVSEGPGGDTFCVDNYCGGCCAIWYYPSGEMAYNSCDSISLLINEFSNTNKTIHILDVLGREATKKGVQLHIYDDGSVEKKYLIK